MAKGKKHTPEQVVSLLRQIEGAVVDGHAGGRQLQISHGIDTPLAHEPAAVVGLIDSLKTKETDGEGVNVDSHI